MRTFVILLLLANIAYFGWNQGWLRDVAPAAPARDAAERPAVPPLPFEQAPSGLRLISELSETERAGLRERDVVVGQSARPPAAAPPAAGDLGDIAADAPELPSERTSPVADTPTVVAWCAELGLFSSDAEALALLPALQALGLTATLRSGEKPVSSTFWVYIPALASQADAQRMLGELQGRGIDSYYMRSGQFAGGISLGVFSRRSSAETVQVDMARRGYDTRIGEVFREEVRFWLLLEAPSQTFLANPEWAAVSARFPVPGLAENVCQSVATGN